MNILKQEYQGDVSVIAISALPENIMLSPLAQDGVVVAIGETKGAKHTIVADKPSLVTIGKDVSGRYWVNVQEGAGAVLTHPTHDVIPLTQPFYVIGTQREADPIVEWRKVRD